MISNCDLGMWMGDGQATFEGKLDIWKNNSCGGASQPRCPPSGNGTYNGTIVTGHGRKGGNVFGNSWIPGTTLMHFRGQSILRESIKKLAALGEWFCLGLRPRQRQDKNPLTVETEWG
eukprot:COSAG04_NODE_8243_length_1002_cov_2.219269_2_plen_117_part_01